MAIDNDARGLAGAALTEASLAQMGVAWARYSTLNYINAPIGLVSNRGKVIASGSDAKFVSGGWNYGGAGGLSAPFNRGGRDAVQLTGNQTAGSSTSIKARHAVPTTTFTKLGIWIETPNVTAGAYTINIYVSSDVPGANPPNADPTNYQKLSLVQGDIMYGSYQCIAVPYNGKLYSQANPSGTSWTTAGTPTLGTISQFHVELVCDSSVPVAQRWLNIFFAELDVSAVPLVMLGFDGTTDAAVTQLFASRNIPWYNASDGNNLLASASFHDDFVSRGNEIVCNGQNHTDYGANSSTLAADIGACRAIYRARGWPMDNTFAYPFNSRSAATDAILVQEGFKAARSFRGPPISYSDRGVPMTVPSLAVAPAGVNGQSQIINFGSYSADQKTAVQMQAWLDDAIAGSHCMNMYAHGLTSGVPSSVQTNTAEYTTFLDYAKTKHEAGLIRLCLPKQFAALMGAS